MISTYFHGEMGNNMFQFAASLAYSEKHNLPIEFPKLRDSWVSNNDRPLELTYMFNHSFNFVDSLTNKYELHIHNDLSLSNTDPNFQFAYTDIPYKDNIMLRGYFQSEKYFENIKDKIKNEYFKPSNEILKKLTKNWLSKYDFNNSISIHVRMSGDRNGNDGCFPYCPSLYYLDGIMEIIKRDSNLSNVFCFSDNIEWCKQNISSEDMIYIEGNSAAEDMFLMSHCKHNVIGNSSFSWWSAYLNDNPDKIVVAPKTWWFGPKLSHLNLKDLFLDDWIKL